MLLMYILLLVDYVFTVSHLAERMKGYAGASSLMEIMQSGGMRSPLLHHRKNRFVAMYSIYSLDHILIYVVYNRVRCHLCPGASFVPWS
jgi:hypothetical protein